MRWGLKWLVKLTGKALSMSGSYLYIGTQQLRRVRLFSLYESAANVPTEVIAHRPLVLISKPFADLDTALSAD